MYRESNVISPLSDSKCGEVTKLIITEAESQQCHIMLTPSANRGSNQSGIKFKKVESTDDPYLDQYMYMGQDFVLTIEKIPMDGYVSCTISVMI